MAYFLLFLASLANALANLFIRAASFEPFGLNRLFKPASWFGILLFLVALALYSESLHRLGIVVSYPIFGLLSLFLIIFFGYRLFQEPISASQILGFLLAGLAIVLISRG